MLKVGMTGSKKYENQTKIKDSIFKLKSTFDNFSIISGGQLQGADIIIKEFSIELGIPYQEFPPYYFSYNTFCVEKYFLFGHKYSKKYEFGRYYKMAKYCDVIMTFNYDNNIDECLKSLIEKSTKENKLIYQIN